MNLKELTHALNAAGPVEFRGATEWEIVPLKLADGSFILTNYADYGPAGIDTSVIFPFRIRENECFYVTVFPVDVEIRVYDEGRHTGIADLTEYFATGTNISFSVADKKPKEIIKSVLNAAIGEDFEAFFKEDFETHLNKAIVSALTEDAKTHGELLSDCMKSIAQLAIKYAPAFNL
jgi:hypothetical protein